MANSLGFPRNSLYNTLMNTVFKGASDNEFRALVHVAQKYELDPMLKQIYAFPQKGGGIVPVVSIDGWIAVVNNQKKLDGFDFSFEMIKNDKGETIPESCTCNIYIKDRSKPCSVTEYYEECWRNSDPWNNMPRRMLRHKAFMQCARLAFGIGGIYDEDEANDIAIGAINVHTNVIESAEEPEMIPGVGDDSAKPEKPKSLPDAKSPETPAPAAEPTGRIQRKRVPSAARPKAEPKPASRPKPETMEPPAEEEEDDIPMGDDSGEDMSPLISMRQLIKDAKVSEYQVVQLCHDLGMIDDLEDASLNQLSEKQVLSIINNWADLKGQAESFSR